MVVVRGYNKVRLGGKEKGNDKGLGERVSVMVVVRGYNKVRLGG